MATFRPNINPEIIQWAREWANIPLDEVSIKVPSYELWERGEKLPTMKQLEALSRRFRTPFGFFFLQEPPDVSLDIPDFRTLSDDQQRRPSPDLLEVVEQMRSRQEWLRQFLIDQEAQELSFVGSAQDRRPIEEVATNIRDVLGLSLMWASEFDSQEDALRNLRDSIEAARIMVVFMGYAGRNTRRTLDVEEFRGFVLSDDLAPLIFVNGRDAKAAQMFTLAHELAHLWINQDALFDLPKLLSSRSNEDEVFCNQVAAEFLVPTSEFLPQWNRYENDADPFLKLSRSFKVSQIVVARKALDLDLVSRSWFFDFYDQRIELFQQKRSTNKSTGGDYWNTQGVRIGRLFGSAVVQAVKEGKPLYTEAFEMAGLRSNTFVSYADRIGVTL
ncbi:MAG: ImmA/IrrE family metallo-endopeptidase [Rhodothermia bacterium]|nr:MAG: ImmA/IrrE family metallo-endopeptidase [Rhodothermia bacterium]